MLKIVAMSDMHGALPVIEPCDLLLIAGDICPIRSSFTILQNHDPGAQRNWVMKEYKEWLEEVPAKQVVWIGGNHDFGVEMAGMRRLARRQFPKHTHYLQDEAIELFGNVIYGLPWTPNLRTWAFYASDRAFEAIAEDIPTDTDILLLHAPPRGSMLDAAHPNWASPHLMEPIVHRIKPKLVVCGHLHEGYGDHEILGVRFANVAYYKDDYETVQQPLVIELED